MTTKDLEKRIEDMRIQYAKEHYRLDNKEVMSRKDWLSIYILLLTKENVFDK